MKWLLMNFLYFVQIVHAIDPWPTPPQTISTPGSTVDCPHIAIDAAGNVIAVWIEDGQLVSKSCLVGGSWGVLQVISSGVVEEPCSVSDPLGLATSVWREGGILYTSDHPLGGAWSTPEALSGMDPSSAVLQSDVLGNLVVVWLEGGYLLSKTRLVGGAWQATPDIISSVGALMPWVAIGGEGLVVAVWQTVDHEIMTASKVLGGSWSSESIISVNGIKSCSPCVTIDNDGNATVVWFRFLQDGELFSDVRVQVIYQPWGFGWGVVQDIPMQYSSAVNPNLLLLKVSSYEESSVLAAWTSSYDGSLYNMEWSICKEGIWRNSEPFVGKNQTMIDFSMGVNFRDEAYIVSSLWEEGTIKIIGGLVNLDGQFPGMGMVWVLSAGGNNADSVTTVNLSGTNTYAGTVWMHHDGVENQIQGIVAQIPIVLPPSNFTVTQVTQDYGVFIQHNNFLSWSLSPSLGAIGYVIFRNGVYLDTVGKTVNSYTDYNKEGSSGVYSIYAFNKYYLSSNIVSFSY